VPNMHSTFMKANWDRKITLTV